jgi:NAD(P)H-quinone oxidoreductase subunit 4
VNTQVRQSYVQIAQTNPSLYAVGFSLPQVPSTEFVSELATVPGPRA